jgi:DNA adenine methylase
MIETQTSSDRVRSPLRYPGGKQKAITKIAKFLPSSATEYREPLAGGASVYFYARSINLAKKYWINDAFKELISFWQVVQDPDKCSALINDLAKLQTACPSAKELKIYYDSAKKECPEDTYRQALLFFFFNRVSFSGTTRAGGFSSAASLLRFTVSSIQRLAFMPKILSDVKITNIDFADIINTPGKDVFMFLDPPYYKAKKLYGHKGNLHQFDHQRLADTLKNTEHKFLITYDDCSEIRHLYKWAKISDWQLQYGMNNCNLNRESKIGAELFISNY